MANLVHVSSGAKFDDFVDLVKHHASFVADKFWAKVKADQDLDALHFSYVYENKDSAESEAAARDLHGVLINCCNQYLSVQMVEELQQINRTNVLHWEIAQASMLEPHEEAAQWALWEKLDAQHEQDCIVDMYRNEY